MVKELIQHITNELKRYDSIVFLVENNDRFLYRPDVIKEFKSYGVDVIQGTAIQQRIHFELREEATILVLLCQDKNNYLEDIKLKSVSLEFHLVNYLSGYHLPSIIELDIQILNKLFSTKQIVSLNKKETIDFVDKIQTELKANLPVLFDMDEFTSKLNSQLEVNAINWSVVCRIISNGILKTICSSQFEELLFHANKANEIFQIYIKNSYHQTKNSSAVKKPKIVSKILDYLNFNFQNEKLALIVIDGLAFWQYELLRYKLPADKNEEVIYSWIPSITQLSRQAIFRGDTPINDYKQGPASEEKLWKNYWVNKGANDFEIKYQHETIDLTILDSVTKLALVFKDLDEKMHSSTDYNDLLKLTENWIERSKISNVIKILQQLGFRTFLTTDHGNIQAKGWRGLQGREKLGTNKSGSRSERHIEYSEQWLTDEFMANNPELKNSVVMEDQAIYFKSDLSFSRRDVLVTHGGAHLLEVLIPFIEISNGE
jgi:hypothetical protein